VRLATIKLSVYQIWSLYMFTHYKNMN